MDKLTSYTELIYKSESGFIEILAKVYLNTKNTIVSITTRDTFYDEVPPAVLKWISEKELNITYINFFTKGSGFQIICQSNKL